MTATAQTFDAAERRKYLGASEVAAIMGLDKYRTPLDVYNEKMGLVPAFEGNRHTERGRKLEAVACDEYTELTGQKLHRRNQAYTHPAHSFIVGHIDRVFVGEKRLAEVKCPSMAAFRKYQREGLPPSMIVQLQMYLGLTGYEKGTWIIFCADAWDMATFDIDFDGEIYAKAVNAAFEFWRDHIEPQIPPRFDTEAVDVEIAKIGGSVIVREDEPFCAKAQAVKEAADLKRDAEELLDAAKKDLIDAFEGECGAYQIPGLARIYYTETAGRVSLDKKALKAAHPELDLTRFEKTGKPFKTLRTYFEG